jgi:hypothetical protein
MGERAANRFGLVSGQVVQHDMHVEIGEHVEIDQLEEREHVGAGVASAGVVQHLSGGDDRRRERVDGAVYRPTPSTSLASQSGSFDSLNVSTCHGRRFRAFQMRSTVSLPTP